jgi:quercetin dioxygenase-like cupin family protein
MAGISKGSFEHSSDIRPFADMKGHMTVVDLDGMSAGRAVFEPGWRWSEHVKPIAGTDSCQAAHAGYILDGHLTVRMDDGTEENFSPGDLMVVHPGHDAWVVGHEPCIMIDWQGALDYAKARTQAGTAKA